MQLTVNDLRNLAALARAEAAAEAEQDKARAAADPSVRVAHTDRSIRHETLASRAEADAAALSQA